MTRRKIGVVRGSLLLFVVAPAQTSKRIHSGLRPLVVWSGYTPPCVYRYTLELLREDRAGAIPFGESVWNSSKHGRLTSVQIEGLVVKLGLNPEWISPKQKQKSGRQPATLQHYASKSAIEKFSAAK